jgi:hypothetical protein
MAYRLLTDKRSGLLHMDARGNMRRIELMALLQFMLAIGAPLFIAGVVSCGVVVGVVSFQGNGF